MIVFKAHELLLCGLLVALLGGSRGGSEERVAFSVVIERDVVDGAQEIPEIPQMQHAQHHLQKLSSCR